MNVYGTGTILQLPAVDIVRLLTATIIYLKCLNTGTIPRLLLKTMVIPRQKVKLGNSFSDAFCPGSTALYSLHYPHSHIISSFNVTHHLYANDTQIHLALDSRNFDSSIAQLTECLACIQKWMVSN